MLVMTVAGPCVGPSPFGGADKSLHGISVVLILPFRLLTLCMGMNLGVILWTLVWEPLLARDEMERYVTMPYVPLVSGIPQEFLDHVYGNGG